MNCNPDGMKMFNLVGSIGDLERITPSASFVAKSLEISHYVKSYGKMPNLDKFSDDLISNQTSGQFQFDGVVGGVFKQLHN